MFDVVRDMSKFDGASTFEFVQSVLNSRDEIKLQWVEGECCHAHHPILHKDEE
jgi:hypothetical protein